MKFKDTAKNQCEIFKFVDLRCCVGHNRQPGHASMMPLPPFSTIALSVFNASQLLSLSATS